MNIKYKETEISTIHDNTLLCAIKDVATYSISIKDHLIVCDDGEWDYKLKKALTILGRDLEEISTIEIGTDKNVYSGEITLERVIKEFADFYELVVYTSPLGEDESRFVIAYEFLENKIKEKKPRESTDEIVGNIHKRINTVSRALYDNGHYSTAVECALKEVIKRVKDYVNPIVNTQPILDGEKLMNRAFGCENQVPVIKFNNVQTIEERDEQKGIMNLFKGVVGIRNRKAHENIILNDPHRAIEYLVLASLLMNLLDEHAN